VLRAGGDGIARWSLYTSPAVKPGPGQLTIIGNGVAFPQVYNLSRFVDVSREHLGRLLHAGLPEYAGNVEIVVQRDSPTGWAVVVRRPGEALGGTVFSGDSRGADGARRVTRVEQIGIGTPGEKTDQWSFESFEPIAGTDITAPRRIEHRTTYSVLEVTSVLELSRVPRRQVEEGAVEPTAEPGITVRDFRDLASPAWAPYETSTRMTWSRSEGADRYDLPTAEDIENSKQRKGMVGLPPPAPSGGGLSRWVIGGTVLIGAIGVPMVLRVWPRKA
jgi:hypothetical protein